MTNSRLLGGQRALLGFYYQLIMSLRIGILRASRVVADDPFFILTNFEVDAEQAFLPEELGQDLNVVAGSHLVLVQFKYSDDPETHPIGLAEIREIMLSFAASIREAGRHGIGVDQITGCLLVTNQPIAGDAVIVNDWAKRSRQLCAWPEDRLLRDPIDIGKFAETPVALGGKQAQLAEILASWSIKEKGGKTKDEGLGDYLLRALPRLHVRSGLHLDSFRAAFETFGSELGALPEEIQDAKGILLGKMLEASLWSPVPLQIEDFRQALTGRRDTRKLTPEGIGPYCRTSWEAWVGGQYAGAEWLLPRDTEDLDAAIATHRIILITGDGGCGKTEALIAATRPIAENVSDSSTFRGFPMLLQSRYLTATWLEDELARWAQRSISSGTAVERLRSACPARSHILWFGLDGIDEHFPAPELMHALCSRIRRSDHDDTRVILTCRTSEMRDVLRMYFADNATGSGEDATDVAIVEIPAFRSPSEVVQALVLALGERFGLMFEAGSGIASHSPGRMLVPPTVPADIRVSLEHPRMLGAFVELRADETTVEAALCGERTALRQVARVFLGRFFRKYAHRQPDGRGFDPRDHASVFRTIAQATREATGVMRRDTDWVSAARQCHSRGKIDPYDLFREAASGGLIVDEGDDHEWQWRHTFVTDCLADDDTRDYLP